MKKLKSYVNDAWYEAKDDFVTLVNPSTEEPVAQVSSTGIDIEAALNCARTRGGPALRGMTFAQRGALLKAMSKSLREHSDELLDLSRINNGTTKSDGLFDIGGAGGTLAYYAGLSKGLGDRTDLLEGDGVQLARSEGFWGQHLLVPRQGVAVHINAFNFPAWGLAEKAACALLAGMPVITKPATATALVAHRCMEIWVENDLLPPGALQFICGRTGDLLDRLGPQDVLAFTGSADTAHQLRSGGNLLRANTRVNVEADSLNAAVLAPDVGEGPTWNLFLRDVAREMTQKAGQKCTAVRRILVPSDLLERVEQALTGRLEKTVTGDPSHENVTMGPLATADQLRDTEEGVVALQAETQVVFGSGQRSDGTGSPAGQGYFFAPTLLRATDPQTAHTVHQREIFAPVATLLSYDGDAPSAATLVARAQGTLVSSVYTDDSDWMRGFLNHAGSTTGRIYWGSQAAAEDAPGSGVALPQTLHGGPGRAGGGEELGGLVGLKLYMQRVALQGARSNVDGLSGLGESR